MANRRHAPGTPDAGRDQVGPTQPLKFRRGLSVLQAGIVTAFAADEFELVGVAAAPGDAGRLAPQDYRPAKRGLALGRVDTVGRGSAHMPPGKVQPVKGYLLDHMFLQHAWLLVLWHHPSEGDLLRASPAEGVSPVPCDGRRGITPERVTRARGRSNSI